MAASPGGSAIIGRVRIQGEVVKISKPHVIYAACRKSGTRHVSRAQRSLLTFVFTGWILCLLLVRSSVVSIAFVKNMYDVLCLLCKHKVVEASPLCASNPKV
ncbi:hypothetical protein M433DRAFT_280261 [Acidomyces richmondensis BFW]|nr:hypothetical protein M433DRAFT_280261 [Acidomyces richmondensis BFW]